MAGHWELKMGQRMGQCLESGLAQYWVAHLVPHWACVLDQRWGLNWECHSVCCSKLIPQWHPNNGPHCRSNWNAFCHSLLCPQQHSKLSTNWCPILGAKCWTIWISKLCPKCYPKC